MSQSITLYRYFSATAGIKTLESSAFRVGRFVELNDPFELLLAQEDDQPKLFEHHQALLHNFHDRFGVLCFCAVVDDPVIWSHYADKHRGLAIEVDAILNDEIVKVHYEKERPIVPKKYSDNPEQNIEKLRPIFQKLISRKSPSWSYEREYRGYADLSKCDVADGMFFHPIPENFVTRVIIGAKSDLNPIYIRKTIDKKSVLKNAKVCKAMLSKRTYEVEIHECL